MTGPTPALTAQRRATAIGAMAVLIWSTLALFTTATGRIPPFQLVAMAFAVAFLCALTKWLVRRQSIVAQFNWPRPVWALGIFGLFGYHALYFLALKTAPPATANLINYLWPLCIVLFAVPLAGERLRWWHVAGVILGLAGTAIVLLAGGGVELSNAYVIGYFAALGCAVVWGLYSVLSRRFGNIPTDAVGAFCGAASLLALFCHFAFEPTVWPADGGEWLAVLALGIGPAGGAFFLWDIGVKHGDIRALGALSYAAPVLSTLLLVVFGRADFSVNLAVSCALVGAGAALAARDLWASRPRQPNETI
jgi:drug/metabolite transporter (DMT)-like permease